MLAVHFVHVPWTGCPLARGPLAEWLGEEGNLPPKNIPYIRYETCTVYIPSTLYIRNLVYKCRILN